MAAPAPFTRPDESNFLHALRLHAAVTPEAIAIIEPNGATATFAELQNRIDSVAHAVVRAGIGRADVVALIQPDGANLLTAFLGVASVAGCAVLNPALSRSETESLLADLGARAVIVDPALDSPAHEVARVGGIPVLDVSARVPQYVPGMPRAGDVALLLQTSATTGKARIVPFTHTNFSEMARISRRVLGLTSADRFLSMMPMFHLQGLMSSVATMLAGGSVICTAGFDADAFPSWMENHHPTWYSAGPTLHHAILPLIASHPELIERSPLRLVRSIGAALSPALMEQLECALKAPILEGYGATETGLVASNTPARRKPGSVGCSAGPEIAIVNESGEILPPGRDGEILVRGPAVIESYRGDPDANRSAFHQGWFRTGDLGRFDAEGFLFITGRIKEIINRGGEKVLPGEVETALLAHPAVAEAVAFGIPHSTLGEDVMAVAVLKPCASVSEPELRRFAAARIAHFKLPRRILFLDAIPKGATGKPSRTDLAAQMKFRLETPFQLTSAPTEIEQRLIAIWQRILQIDQAGAHDDFFDLGGDSLALTLLMTELELEFSPEDHAEFLAEPTIQTLAGIVTRCSGTRAGKSFLVGLQPHGSRNPFFCIPGADENPYYFLELAKGLGRDQPFWAIRDPRPFQDRGLYSVEEHASLFYEAIRSKRPRGPYLLGGHCYGGILAFEVARQLVADGQEIELLVLFEVPTPGYPKVARHWRKYLTKSASMLPSLMGVQSGHLRAQVGAHLKVWRRLFERKKEALARRALLTAGLQQVVGPAEKLDCRNVHAGRAYAPGKLPCNVVHFLAADEHHSTVILDDPRLGWRDMVGPGFSVCKVPGIADGIFKPPHVSELTAQLRGRLELSRLRQPFPVC